MIKRVNRLKYNWSDKHIEYMRRTQHSAINIAEGSIRSGKTTDNIFCFAHDLKHSRDKIHLATASTQPTAKLVIGDCDGYGLEHIFRGQCKWGKYKGNECLKIKGIDTGYKEKIVLFCGGAKADSYKKFRGMSIGLWIATEINLHHEDTIREAQRRQINADIKRFYWDLNPGSPSDKIYTDFIDDWQEKADGGILKGGYNYQAFNIFDNVNLSKANLESELSKYTVGSVFYRRDILGERCVAEGLIFRALAEQPERYIIKKQNIPKLHDIFMGADWGGNKSAHALACSAIGSDGAVYVLKAIKKQAPDVAIEELRCFVYDFLEYIENGYGLKDDRGYDILLHVIGCDCDHNDVIINSLNDAGRRIFDKTYKPPLPDRVALYSILLASGRLKFVEGECDDLINEMKNMVFDEKSAEAIPLDDGTMQIDAYDSLTYSRARRWHYLTK